MALDNPTPEILSSSPNLDARNLPVQERSAARMAAILDATATIIDEGGIEAVTVTAVAYRSGSSVGAVYRFFPSTDGLLRALAQRNLLRFMERVEEGSRNSSDIPWSSLGLTLEAYVDMYRTEPSFRSLRFGDIITDKFLSSVEPNLSAISRAFAGMVSETHNVPLTDDMVFHMEVALTTCSALIDLAFKKTPDGDERLIEQARAFSQEYLPKNVPIQPTR